MKYERRVEVLEEGHELVGKKCIRNGCTEFQVGDKVWILHQSVTGGGQELVGLHDEHHTEAMAVIKSMFGPK